LLRGACHRAALRADPLARNDGASGSSVDSTFRTVHRRHTSAFIADTLPHSRGGFRPSFAFVAPPLLEKGAGKAGSPLLPWPPVHKVVCVCSTGGKPQGSQDIPAFPARWFYGLCRALPGERCTIAPVALRLIDARTRSGRCITATLDARTPGARTTRFCRPRTTLSSARYSRSRSPALRSPSRRCGPCPPPSGPRVVTIAIRPFSSGWSERNIRQSRNSVNKNIFTSAA
jgi:hypothetical protein